MRSGVGPDARQWRLGTSIRQQARIDGQFNSGRGAAMISTVNGPVPRSQLPGWFGDYSKRHPHKIVQLKSPRE